jgi:uncharacterized membrane protein YfcA
VLAVFFIAVAAVTATLASLTLTRAQDPVVRLAGRFAPAVAAGAFLSVRVLGLAVTAWLVVMTGLAACVVTALVLLERYSDQPPSELVAPLRDRSRVQRDRAARATRALARRMRTGA